MALLKSQGEIKKNERSKELAGFFQLVKKTREAQKNYFKTKTGIEQSKNFERLLDNAIRKIDEIHAQKQQKTLF